MLLINFESLEAVCVLLPVSSVELLSLTDSFAIVRSLCFYNTSPVIEIIPIEMFQRINENIRDKFSKDNGKNDGSSSEPLPPFSFEGKNFDDAYQYPNLYDEADEMLQISMLIYSLADLRTLAKDPARKDELKSPEKMLNLPLSLPTCLEVLEDNYDAMKECLGDADHVNTINSLNMIHRRFEAHRALVLSSTNDNDRLFNSSPATTLMDSNGSVEVDQVAPMLTHFVDENSDVDMVYAIGVDQFRKRITVAFRGSVTTTDFQKDAMISLNRQPNPVRAIDSNQEETMGIHHGFYDYLLRPRENDMNKYQEIIDHVKALFQQPEYRRNYKLYVTGHSLGGALATLFSLHAAASAGLPDDIIPKPVCCISVASPRVGDRNFQEAFLRLEEQGLLRHLRIANDRDPVTMMPSATGKKVWATLSPISYLAFKLMDSKFEEKEYFYHTGVKLRLAKDKWELLFLGVPMAGDGYEAYEVTTEEDTDSCISENTKSTGSVLSKSTSFRAKKRDPIMPDVSFHLGNSYAENLGSVKTHLHGLSLNSLYQNKGFSIYQKKFLKE